TRFSRDWSSDVCSSDLAVDHDGLVPLVAQGERRVTAAVVELDALPDAVRAAAKDDGLRPRGRFGLALILERAVHVGRERLELGRSEERRGGNEGRARGW